jgi:sugar lactone lactonase YvrE
MLQTLRDRLTNPTRAILACAVLAVPVAASADEYSEARAELVAAWQAGDVKAMRAAAGRAVAARPDNPGALFNRALAEVLDEDIDATFNTLRELAAMDIYFDVEAIPQFAPLIGSDEWASFQAFSARLRKPHGQYAIAYTVGMSDFVPEGIAVGDEGELYLGSIRQGIIARVSDTIETLSVGDENGFWSVFGMRLVGNELWFSSASVPQYLFSDPDNAGRTGLFRLDLESHELTRRAILEHKDEEQLLGDLVVNGDSIYTTDSATGRVYHYSINNDSYSVIVDSGVFGSPQGLVLDASGEHLYVADYTSGLFRIRLADRKVERVKTPATVSDYGIDGLYRDGDALLLIQNGIQPHRVAYIELQDDGITSRGGGIIAMNLPEFDEPTLGTLARGSFYWVANSHWNRFDADNDLPQGLSGPIILRVPPDGSPGWTK